jgi:hypothetical protein
MSWIKEINWSTPAAMALKKLFARLPTDRKYHITLFGSSPLQLGLDASFLSADVDLFGTYEDRELLTEITEQAGLSKGNDRLYVQVCVPGNFRTSPRWTERSFTTEIGNITLTLPHPIDILIAKLHRLADKDLAAFRLVIDRTGHPTEEELRRELQYAVDLYRPNFDEEMVGDITTNTRVLWQELWGKDIDVRKEIIRPAIEARRDGYDFPKADYRAELRRLSQE